MSPMIFFNMLCGEKGRCLCWYMQNTWCDFVIFPWLSICSGDNTPPFCFHTATELSTAATVAKSTLTLSGCSVGRCTARIEAIQGVIWSFIHRCWVLVALMIVPCSWTGRFCRLNGGEVEACRNSYWCWTKCQKTMWSLHKEREWQLRFSLVAPVTVARLWHRATILYLRIARLDSCWKCWTRTPDGE